jgi:hypothetical protein
VLRRVLLAVLLAASMTLTGFSACESPLGEGRGDCGKRGQWCFEKSVQCCSGLTCGAPDSDGLRHCE